MNELPASASSTAGASVQPTAPSRLRFGDCEISRHEHVLLRSGVPRPIRRKVFEVLLLLIDQRPQTLSHERIAREVWGHKSFAAKQVARAVMEARREIGDNPDAPRYILSVRGVGYRFAGDVFCAEIGAQPMSEEAESGVHVARVDTEAAARCLRRGDFEEARLLVDRAITMADLAGARPELARALALAACVLLRFGSHERATALAAQAVRMAQLDGRSDVLADAQLGMAEVHLRLGSAHAALDHLLLVHRRLAALEPGHAHWRCESLMAQAYREIGQAEEAWRWCEQALASALRLEPQTRAVHERLVMVAVLQCRIEAAEAVGHDAAVLRHGSQSLEILDTAEPDARAVGSIAFELTCQTYRAAVLEAMGRVKEGWAVLDALRPVLFGCDKAPPQWMAFRRKEFRQVEAGLLSRAGRTVEALQAIEAAIELSPKVGDSPLDPSSVQGLAARICERAGLYQDALEWMRRQRGSDARLHADRAQSTAAIVRAQLEADRLGEDLSQARADVQRLQQLNLELEQRILRMDRHALIDEGGLVPAAALAATIDGRASLARERALPLCIGIVEALVPPDEGSIRPDLALQRRIRRLSSTLKAVIPDASAPAQWRPGLFFFLLHDMGLAPARQRCLHLAQRLNAEMVPTTMPGPLVNFRADALDVTQFGDVEAALGQRRALNIGPSSPG